MTSRDEKLLSAARSVFLRYGVSKTTMHDIAAEAGVARQTLYNAYPGKDAILRATLKATGQEGLDAVAAQWGAQTTLAEKLDTYFAMVPLAWYDLAQSCPAATDLVDGMHNIAKEELIAIGARWTTALTALLRQHAPEHPDPEAIADLIQSASFNAKVDAPDRETVARRLAVLKAAILALLNLSEA